MNQHELNKKLAEWAGLITTGHNTTYADRERTKIIGECDVDYYTGSPIPPDFTNSLDACFKWLMLKLPDYYITFTIYPDNKVEAYVMYYPNGKNNGLEEAYGRGDISALALCLAIEKLIDSEVASATD